MTGTYETCCICDSKTDRAGIAEDSLYIDDCGPFCEDCYERIMGAYDIHKKYAAVVFDERREYIFFENDLKNFAKRVMELREAELVEDVKTFERSNDPSLPLNYVDCAIPSP